MFYGVVNKRQIVEYAVAVCNVIGHGSNYKAVNMLVETAAAETLLSEFKDPTPDYAGAGLSQVDKETFIWIVEKYEDSGINERLIECFGVDLSLVQYEELDFSPLLSMIFSRLRYWVVEAPIPNALKDRGEYWKKHYNSYDENAKGSIEKFVERVSSLKVQELIDSVWGLK